MLVNYFGDTSLGRTEMLTETNPTANGTFGSARMGDWQISSLNDTCEQTATGRSSATRAPEARGSKRSAAAVVRISHQLAGAGVDAPQLRQCDLAPFWCTSRTVTAYPGHRASGHFTRTSPTNPAY